MSLINLNYDFVPFAGGTIMGSWCQEAITFINDIIDRITIKTNPSFPVQRLSFAIQIGNAASIIGTFRDSK